MLNILTIYEGLFKDNFLDPYSVAYLTRRLRNEGLSFATCTLPKFGKLVLQSIEDGKFFHYSSFTNFAWKGALPRVFRGLLSRIFDAKLGVVLPTPCPVALKRIRQVCEYFYKLALPFKDGLEESAMASFIETDASLASPYNAQYVDQLRKDFETYYKPLSKAVISDVFQNNKPRSGPGTFSDKKIFESETALPWYNRKFIDYSAPKSYPGLEGFSRPIHSAPMQGEARTVDYSEVMFVPKDSRGPRTIVREPFSTLRYQMGFHDWIKGHLEKISSGRINFQDQQVNRDLAKQSSITRDWATLDLSAASDRVSAKICEHIFRGSPAIRYMVAKRTRKTRLPNGEFLVLNKLSGMGSGLTFPLMSLLISLTITRSIANYSRIPYAQARKLVYVYGDDIIVPSKYVKVAIGALQAVKLEVGIEKSFVKGPFRESCGGDYLCGVSVVPVRAKFSSTKLMYKGVQLMIEGNLSIIAVERHIRELVKEGLDSTAAVYIQWLTKKVKNLPYVSGESPVLGIYVKDLPESWIPRDEYGNFVTLKVILPVPDCREGLTDDYIYLSQALKRSRGCDFIRNGFSDKGSAYNEVSIPRSIKYIRKRVSGLMLLG